MKEPKVGTLRWWMEVYQTKAPKKIAYFKGKKCVLYRCGLTRDGYEVWTPLGNAMSAWAKVEYTDSHSQYVYDPGGHWRSTLTNKA